MKSDLAKTLNERIVSRSRAHFVHVDEGSSAPVFVAQPLQQTVIEGSDVTLECAANGYPKPTILWLKDGVALDLTSSDSRYRIDLRL